MHTTGNVSASLKMSNDSNESAAILDDLSLKMQCTAPTFSLEFLSE